MIRLEEFHKIKDGTVVTYGKNDYILVSTEPTPNQAQLLSDTFILNYLVNLHINFTLLEVLSFIGFNTKTYKPQFINIYDKRVNISKRQISETERDLIVTKLKILHHIKSQNVFMFEKGVYKFEYAKEVYEIGIEFAYRIEEGKRIDIKEDIDMWPLILFMSRYKEEYYAK